MTATCVCLFRRLPVLVCAAVVCTVTGLSAARSQAQDADLPQLTAGEVRGGWKLLFDGRSTAGWRNYRSEKLSDGWQVRNGALEKTRAGAGDIVTAQQYQNFELSLEYKISKGGNSGIMFRVTEDDPRPWASGPEVQVQDNVDGRDPQKAGWLYQLYQPMPDFFTKKVADATRPVGEWNQVTLKITPAVCEINMNGIRYAM
ncbi:MAG: DUF1080 domain-containing protein, partial [Planctomycetaceae bacterium]